MCCAILAHVPRVVIYQCYDTTENMNGLRYRRKKKELIDWHSSMFVGGNVVH